jgi:hypothetical protein
MRLHATCDGSAPENADSSWSRREVVPSAAELVNVLFRGVDRHATGAGSFPKVSLSFCRSHDVATVSS